ncbi:TonB-dependent receptor [Arenibacter palladensis]|uniref:TonB-dependent receptor n=1 Tax=Arenibacter palladensis TaxID=237373 RepID=UPI002FD63CF8
MKKPRNTPEGWKYLFPKFDLKMKLSLLLLFTTILQLQAGMGYAQKTKITLNMSKVSVLDVINEIESVSEFKFFYSKGELDLNRKVDIQVKEERIQSILKALFSNTKINYKVLDKQVVLKVNKTLGDLLKPSTQGNLKFQVEQFQVSGTITDTDGMPLPGASIVEKGTSNGTQTDFDGNFNISVKAQNAILVVSYLGFSTKEVALSGQSQLNIILEESAAGLDEVVVVGYGTQKRANVTGAVSQIGQEVFEDRATADIATSLQGALPNLNINIYDGSPNATPDFNIRGFESLNGGSPLILVDGIPYETLNDFSPADIASVTVLKDAASAAIYGARGAFGVILVTTKNGRLDTPTKIKFSHNTTFSDMIITPDPLNSVESANAANLARTNNGQSALYNDEHIQYMQDYIDDPINNPSYYLLPNGNYQTAGNADIYKEAYADFAVRNTTNLSLSGGGSKSTYYGSLSYVDDEGQWRVNPDEKKRYNTLFKYTFDVNDWLTAGFRAGYNKTSYDEPHAYGIGTYWHALDRSKPWQLVETPEGFPQGAGLPMNHTLAYQRFGGRTITETQETNLSADFAIKPFKGMVINANYSHQNLAAQLENNRQQIEFVTDNTPETVNYLTSANDYIQRRSRITTQDVVDIYATYDFDINQKHNFKILAGYNQTSSEFLEIEAIGFGLIKDDILSVENITGEDFVGDSNTFTAIRGGFGRFNYNFDEKYFLEVNARYDGSDVFPKDNRFGFFPSASVGWVVSKESFFNSVPLVSNLKFRASYGSLGNQDVPADDFRPLLTTRNGTLNYLIDGVEPLNILPASIVSNTLTWETATTTNFGVDLGMFKNKFNMSLDIYKRVTSDMIVAGEALPAPLGTSAPRTNGATLETNGFELEFGWRQKLRNGLTYGIKGYLSDSKSEITDYDLNPSGRLPNLNNNNFLYEGQILGEIWGYETVGIFQSQEEIDAAPDHSTLNANAGDDPGDTHYRDLNGDGEISSGSNTLDDPGDKTIIGNATPRYNYGFTTTLEYKGIDFNMFFRGVGEKDIAMQNQNVAYFGHSAQANNVNSTGNHWALENSWSPENPDAKLPIYRRNSAYNVQTQSRFLESGAFLRLKNITLGYTFPENVVEKANLHSFRIYLSGQNLWTKDNLYGLMDPETLGDLRSTNGKIYPNRKSVAVGIQVSL